MTKSAAATAALATLFVCSSAVASQQTSSSQAKPVFRSAVDLVSVAAVVRDRHGRFARNLRKEDFVVEEELGRIAADQVATSLDLIARVVPSRAFTVEAGGEPVSWCALYEEDGIGQIDDVVTAPVYRRRGFGRAVVEVATRASLAAGNRITFLVADDDDWPKELYARIGYEAIGRRFEFTRS